MRLACLLCALATFFPMAYVQADELRELRLSSAPHAPGDAPDVIVHVPSSYAVKRPLHVVVFLHGFDCCARALVAHEDVACARGERPSRAWGLGALHEAAGTGTLLLVPQLAYRARNGQQHRFQTPGAFDRMLHEVLAAISERTKGAGVVDVERVTLVAHSGGYGALVPILRDPARRAHVQNVVLLDALYAGWDEVAAWYRSTPDARLVSLHTAQQQTMRGNATLGRILRTQAGKQLAQSELQGRVAGTSVVIAKVRTAHRDIPQVHLADILRALAMTGEKAPPPGTGTAPGLNAR